VSTFRHQSIRHEAGLLLLSSTAAARSVSTVLEKTSTTTKPVDFRKGMDGLAALAQQTTAQDPFSGARAFFRGR
jgi:hypothetical protein